MGGLATGAIFGYASPATFQLREPDPSLNATLSEPLCKTVFGDGFSLNEEQLAWFSSAVDIGALIGGLSSSFIVRGLGRRGTCLASCLPCIVGWLMIGTKCMRRLEIKIHSSC